MFAWLEEEKDEGRSSGERGGEEDEEERQRRGGVGATGTAARRKRRSGDVVVQRDLTRTGIYLQGRSNGCDCRKGGASSDDAEAVAQRDESLQWKNGPRAREMSDREE
ncbi:hypothetical protein U1Q18_015882 [Sarracenia purpurea var. burkii]